MGVGSATPWQKEKKKKKWFVLALGDGRTTSKDHGGGSATLRPADHPHEQTLKKFQRVWPLGVVTHNFFFFFFIIFCHGVDEPPQTGQAGCWATPLLLFSFFNFYFILLFLNIYIYIYCNGVVFRLSCWCWRGQTVTQPNRVNKMGWKMGAMTHFKNAKKLKSKCLKFKSDGLFSNCVSTQWFVIHLPIFKWAHLSFLYIE